MLVAGVTGGIGSGKSTFARLLGERGAEIIDADQLGRSALDPGRTAWNQVVEMFGDEILVPGTLDVDRKQLARIVFSDRKKLSALNAIVHPVIVAGIADTLETLRGTDEVVVLDAALIVELGLHHGLDLMILVVAEREVRLRRLLESRGMTAPEAEERIAAQASDEELRARADIVIENNGSLEHLERAADEVWAELNLRRLS